MAPAIVRLQMLAALREAWALRWPGLALGPATPDRSALTAGGRCSGNPWGHVRGMPWALPELQLALGPATPEQGTHTAGGRVSQRRGLIQMIWQFLFFVRVKGRESLLYYTTFCPPPPGFSPGLETEKDNSQMLLLLQEYSLIFMISHGSAGQARRTALQWRWTATSCGS